MDKMYIRKDIYDELLEKGFGKKDMSKLTKKKITDKNGHTRTVYVRNGEQPATQQQPKAQDKLTPEKKARYEEMLEQVKAGPEENALFVRGKGMLNKKDAIAHLSEKLGVKAVNSAAQGHLESDTPQNTDITKEDEERFGKQALSGLSGKRTGSEEKKENYLDAKNEAGKDIAENNKIENISETIKFSPEEMKVIKTVAEKINYQPGDEGYLLNTIYSENKEVYSALTKKNKEAWDKSGKKQKTFSSTDLLKEKIKSMNGNFNLKEESLKDKLVSLKNNGEEYIEDDMMKTPIDDVIKFVDEVQKEGYGMTPFVGLSNYMKKNGYSVNNAGGVFIVKPKPKEIGNGKTLTDDLMDMKNNGETYIVNKYMKMPIDEVIKLSKEIDKDGYTMTPFVGTSEYFKEKGYRVQNAGGVFVIKKPVQEEQ